MNLPLPSGSSPPEKPPGIKTRFAFSSLSEKAATLSETDCAVRLFITKISASKPASQSAFALSYSQFVPGKTGISARGRAVFNAGAFTARLR